MPSVLKNPTYVFECIEDLVEWTRKWMSSLPAGVSRALTDEEVSVLKRIFILRLSGEIVTQDNVDVPPNMMKSRLSR